MRLQVEVQSHILRVVIEPSATIADLCKETEKRFNSHPEVVTKVEISVLKTKDGATLFANDLVGEAVSNEERLVADVMSCTSAAPSRSATPRPAPEWA
jgi:hypothetical protein